ncbi:uncharacterized protein J3D65DRAFT_628795 [Phyllosticta citribraziliensis]|uniref:Uncharacterized protein n=1 Tax=Phyllosticta citribraziliensis TaxID=989973 RepID=A0ABR1LHL7_9PEZI
MRYTRPVRRAYAWPRLDRGFDGVGRPPLDLGKALPPIPRGADSGCESDEDGAFGAAVGARARTRPQSSQQRSSAKQKDDGKPHPHPRRLSLSLSALPDTPFLGALDVSRLAVGEERVFRLPPPPPASTTTTATATEEAAVTASGLSRSFEPGAGRGMKMRRHGSAPQPTTATTATTATVKEMQVASSRGRFSCDDAASSSRRGQSQPHQRSRSRPPPSEPERPHSRTESTSRSEGQSAVDQEVDGIARRLAFAIKNGRAKGTRAVKVSWVVGY